MAVPLGLWLRSSPMRAALDVAAQAGAALCAVALAPSEVATVMADPAYRDTSKWAPATVGASSFRSWTEADAASRFHSDLSLGSYVGLHALLVPPLPHASAASPGLFASVAQLIATHFAQRAGPSIWFRAPADEAGTCRRFQQLKAELHAHQVPDRVPEGKGTCWADGTYARGLCVALAPDFSQACRACPPSAAVHWNVSEVRRMRGLPVGAVLVPLEHLCATSALFAPRVPAVAEPLLESGATVVGVTNESIDAAASITIDVAALIHPECPAFRRGEEARLAERDGSLWSGLLGGDAARAAAASFRQYANVPQVPLQPLAECLPSATYEVFEADTPKYLAYENAIRQALKKTCSTGGPSRVVVFVVGAGRGPLVDAALRALSEVIPSVVGRRPPPPLHVVALEKNAAAVALLKARREIDPLWVAWVGLGGERCLEVVSGDCRAPQTTQALPVVDHADCVLVVSELLGSLGDNELSPECVEGFLNASGLRSHPCLHVIPAASTSFVTPIGSSVLIDALLGPVQFARVGRGKDATLQAPFHQLHVVHAQAVDFIAANATSDEETGAAFQPVFEFQHPSPSGGDDDTFCRHTSLRFQVDHDASFSGVYGAFRALLAAESSSDVGPPVALSTVPNDHTPDMYSWFGALLPLLFPHPAAGDTPSLPLEATIDVLAGDLIEVSIWRKSDAGTNRGSGRDGSRVWLEWEATVHHRATGTTSCSLRMNPDGRFYGVGLEASET